LNPFWFSLSERNWRVTVSLGLVSLLASSGMAQREESKIPHVFVLQGVVKSVSDQLLIVRFPETRFQTGREVNIEKAVYQTAAGDLVEKFPITLGMKLIVIVNAEGVLTKRAPIDRLHPNVVKYRPLQAIVVEQVRM